MIEFRQAQFDALGRSAHQRSIDVLARVLKRRHPHLAGQADDSLLLAFCEHGVRRARSYALTSTNNITTYVVAMSLLGAEFDQSTPFLWARQILASPGMAEDIKVGLLRLRLMMDLDTDVGRHGE